MALPLLLDVHSDESNEKSDREKHVLYSQKAPGVHDVIRSMQFESNESKLPPRPHIMHHTSPLPTAAAALQYHRSKALFLLSILSEALLLINSLATGTETATE